MKEAFKFTISLVSTEIFNDTDDETLCHAFERWCDELEPSHL